MARFNKLTPIKRFFNLLKIDKQDIISIYVYALFSGLISLSIPLGIQAIINIITVGQVSTTWIVLVFFVILGIAFSGVMQIIQLSITENIQQKIFTRSAFEFAYRIIKMNPEKLDKKHSPELVNRFFDTVTIQKGISKIIIDFSTSSLQILFGLILLSLYHPFFIIFSFLLLLIVYLIFKLTVPQGLKTSINESNYKYEMAHWLEEIARSSNTFKLAGNSTLPLSRTDENVTGYLTQRKAHFKTLMIQYINLVGFKIIIAAGLLIIGGLLVINQKMNIGQFVAAEIIIILILASVEKLILSIETIYDVLTAIEKVGGVTDLDLEQENPTKLNLTEDDSISLKVTDLTYKFRDEKKNILSNINFELLGGNSLCVSGHNGSGKSFLLQTLSGLFDSYKGTITINKQSLTSLNKDELRTYIGDCLGSASLFKGTILENITLQRPNLTFLQVQQVIDALGLNEFIETLPKGINSVILPEGKNLPKSIRIKIILARGIVGSPKLLLIDDDFNQLNKEDKNKFLNYLFEKDKKWSIILVSNDLNIMERFNSTMVLVDGKLIAIDSLNNLKKETWFNNFFQTN